MTTGTGEGGSPDPTPEVAPHIALLQRVGEGAVAHVWRAADRNTETQIAVKILRPDVIDLETVQRLAQEVEILSHLHHPCIVRVLGTGVAPAGQPYVMMGWIEGITLRDKLDQSEKIAVADVIDVVNQICSALEEAHRAQVVHRDLKPENVLLCSPEHVAVKVVDFGMAKVLRSAAPNLTLGDNNIFGTPQYMAPERCRGKPVDARSDVYAMGVIAYEMLCRRRPFDSPSPMQTLLMHVNQAVPEMPEVVPPLAQVVALALSKTPADRPGAGDFARRLELAARGCGALG